MNTVTNMVTTNSDAVFTGTNQLAVGSLQFTNMTVSVPDCTDPLIYGFGMGLLIGLILGVFLGALMMAAKARRDQQQDDSFRGI